MALNLPAIECFVRQSSATMTGKPLNIAVSLMDYARLTRREQDTTKLCPRYSTFAQHRHTRTARWAVGQRSCCLRSRLVD